VTQEISVIDVAQAAAGDIMQLVQALARSGPLTRAKVSALLGVQLEIADENAYFVFLKGKGPQLPDGTAVQSIDLRLAKANPDHHGAIALEISGRCLTLADLKRIFPKLELVDVPRGRTHDESFSYAATGPEATVNFGFKERAPNCVSSISVKPA
jgi:hypothetical protein